MEFIFELIIELLFEGGIEISSNKKISKWIRYPILALLVLFFAVVIFGIIFLGIILLKDSLLGGILMILIGIIMLVASILKFKKLYLEKIIK